LYGIVEHLSVFFQNYADAMCYGTGALILIVLFFVFIKDGGIPKPVKKCEYCGDRHNRDECCTKKSWWGGK